RHDALEGRLVENAVLERGSERQESTISYGVYTLSELRRLLEDAGWRVASACGTLEGRPFALGDRRLRLAARGGWRGAEVEAKDPKPRCRLLGHLPGPGSFGSGVRHPGVRSSRWEGRDSLVALGAFERPWSPGAGETESLNVVLNWIRSRGAKQAEEPAGQ